MTKECKGCGFEDPVDGLYKDPEGHWYCTLCYKFCYESDELPSLKSSTINSQISYAANLIRKDIQKAVEGANDEF